MIALKWKSLKMCKTRFVSMVDVGKRENPHEPSRFGNEKMGTDQTHMQVEYLDAQGTGPRNATGERSPHKHTSWDILYAYMYR